jgi:mannose-6-phosphate isomerase-like protein (cupin superfamily)
LSTVNGNAVRLRVVERFTATWHIHNASDELFYVISGTVMWTPKTAPTNCGPASSS